MREPRDTRRFDPSGLDQLNQQPHAEQNHRRDAHNPDDHDQNQQGQHACSREQDDVGAEDPGDRAARTDHRDRRGRSRHNLRDGSAKTA